MRISDWSSDVCSPDLCSLIISVMQSRKDFCIPRRASCCSRWRLHSSSPLMRCLDGYSSCERLDCEWYAAGCADRDGGIRRCRLGLEIDAAAEDGKSVAEGKSVTVSVELGWHRN